MALMFPPKFPHDLSRKPKLFGEKLVYEALGAGLDDSWSVYYDRPVHGTARRVDFVAIDPARGVVAIEVKGGLVHASRGAFRQLITQSGQRKRVEPSRTARGSGMLNLYSVKVWHLSGPRHFEMIEVRTYTARRAEDLASESFPGCMAAAKRIFNLVVPPGHYVMRKKTPPLAA